MLPPIKIDGFHSIPNANWLSHEPVVVCNITLPNASETLSGVAVLDAIDHLKSIHPRFDWAPLVPLSKNPLMTLAHAISKLSLYLLNEARGNLTTIKVYEIAERTRVAVVVGSHVSGLTKEAITLAIECLYAAASNTQNGTSASIKNKLDLFWRKCQYSHPDYQSRILMLGAKSRGISFEKCDFGRNYWRCGSGKNSLIFRETVSQQESALATELTRDKSKTTRFLELSGFPTAKQQTVGTLSELSEAWKTRSSDIVIKPLDGAQGRGITVKPQSAETARTAFVDAQRHTASKKVIIEDFVPGDDFRLLVVGGKFKAATMRRPPQVIGDGKSTITELCARLNTKRASSAMTRRYLKKISASAEILIHLQQNNYDWNSVPDNGTVVTLRGNANVSTGGEPADVTDFVHQSIVNMVENIARLMNVHALGVDYITPDISDSPGQTGGKIIELNTCPGLALHVESRFRESGLGASLIPQSVTDVPATVIVADAETFDENSFQWSDAAEIDGHFVIAGSRIFFSEQCNTLFSTSKEAVNAALLRKDCVRISVICNANEFIKTGIPINFADTLIAMNTNKAVKLKLKLTAKNIMSTFAEVDDHDFKLTPSSFKNIVKNSQPADVATQIPASPERRLRAISGVLCEQVLKINLQKSDTFAFCMIRNEIELLPFFFDHYRKMGITSFVVFDDQSNDGSATFLANQPDVHLLSDPSLNFGSDINGVKFKHAVKELIPEILGSGRWWLVVDADEFLVLPPPYQNINDFYAYADRRSTTCVFASMVDFYPDSFPIKRREGAETIFQAYPYYDVGTRCRRLYEPYRVEKTLNGIRGRLIQNLRKQHPAEFEALLGGKGYIGPALNKVPIIKTGMGFQRPNAHQIFGSDGVQVVPPVDLEVLLAHFKVTESFMTKAQSKSRTENYYHQGIDIEILKLAIIALDGQQLSCGNTREFETVEKFYTDVIL